MPAIDRKQGGRLLAAALIGGGALLLVSRLFDRDIGSKFWPFFVIVPGVALLAISLGTRGRESRLAASAGAVVAGTGIILLAQAMTDYFQSWAYAWTLLPVLAGAALTLVGQRDADAAIASTGLRLVKWGAAMFFAFTVAFEGLIFHRYLEGGGLVLPIILIVLGIVVLAGSASEWKIGGAKAKQGGAGNSTKGPSAAAPL